MFNYLVKKAKYIEGYKVWLTFADGKSGEVDLTQKLKNRGGVFEPLQDVNYFKNFEIIGSTIAWKNGAELAPESLYELFNQQNKNK